MTELLQQALTWVNANPGWAGLLVFVIAFSESLAIVGVIVPGVVILFGIGVMIGAGALNFWAMVAWAVTGAILGDGLSFWIGRHFSDRLTKLWPFNKHPETLQRGIAFFDRYGGKSVAIGRFFGPVRAIIPLVAGMLHMSPTRFTVANVLSALAWAPVYLLPGMAFGATLELASEIALRMVILLIIIAALLWLLGWLAHRIFIFLTPRAPLILERLVRLGQRNYWLHEIAEALSNPRHKEAAGLGIFAAILIASSIMFVLATLVASGVLGTLDRSLQLVLQALTTPTGDYMMLAVSAIADRSSSLAILLLIWGLLKIFKQPIAARHWLVGVGSIWLITLFAEYWLRQDISLITVIPDLYVLRASAQFGLAAILFNTAIAVEKRWRLYSAATILIAMVTFAQLYHGSGLSAVINALSVGLLWTTAIGVASRTHGYQEKMDTRRVTMLSLLVFMMVVLSALSTSKPPPRPMMQLNWDVISADQWWQSDWKTLASVRQDVTEIHNQPLNLQYLGQPDALMMNLEKAGWKQAAATTGVDWLATLSASLPLEQYPVFPRSHKGKYDDIRIVKNNGKQRLVIRLWRAPLFVMPGGQTPLWLGNISSQHLQQKLGLISVPKTNEDDQQVLTQLQKDLSITAMTYKSVNNQTIILIRNR